MNLLKATGIRLQLAIAAIIGLAVASTKYPRFAEYIIILILAAGLTVPIILNYLRTKRREQLRSTESQGDVLDLELVSEEKHDWYK